jgi:hypothetical protein
MANPCATCPFLAENRGKSHANGWYTLTNLRRLWNGLRTGRAPGMVCHSTDPKNVNYGGDKPVTPGHERECVAANTLIQRELNTLATYTLFKDYRRDHPDGLTRPGLGFWLERITFGSIRRPIEIADPNDTRIQKPPRSANA